MFTSVHKVNDGMPFVNNCFPVRNQTRGRPTAGSGAWMVVYRNKQKKQLKAVLCSKPKTFEEIRRQREIAVAHGIPIRDVSLPTEKIHSLSARLETGKTLTKRFLLKHLKLVHPEDTAVIRIESCDLVQIDDRGMEDFTNILHVKAADNILPLEAFAKIPSIEILEMQMNGIGSISSVTSSLFSNDTVSLAEVYPNLKQLNLDFNDIGPSDLDALSYLTNLESLSVVGNKLGSFPAPDYQRMEANIFFPKLTELDMSDNAVCNDSDFLYLCGIPKLQKLTLSGNGIKSVPSIHFTGHRYAVVASRHTFGGSPLPEEGEDDSARALSTIAETTSERSSPALLLLPPFPELFIIDLSNNFISTDIALAGVLAWPFLKEVILDGNPLAKREEKLRRRMLKKPSKADAQQKAMIADATSSICNFLEQSLGINVVRSKPTEKEHSRPSVGSALNTLRKYPNLDVKVPKVPRCDVDKLLALAAPPAESESPALSPPPKITKEDTIDEVSPPLKLEKEEKPPDSDANIQFFMTELAPEIDEDQLRAECELALGSKSKTDKNEGKEIVLHDPRFAGFEELLTSDDEVIAISDKETLELPRTLRESVHSLRNMLELPSVSRRPVRAIEAWADRQLAARRRGSDSLASAPSGPQPRRFEPLVTRHKRLAPPKDRSRRQVVREVVSAQKELETVDEAPLRSVMRDGRAKNPVMYRNARRLLRRITGQYNRLRADLEKVNENDPVDAEILQVPNSS